MEHQTMTTIHRQWARSGSVNGIVHELAHQWWGDMVTCLDWRNIWLNEGFATYSDELYEYHYRGRSSFISLIQGRADDYFSEEASDPHPIYDPPPGHEFDWGHSYCKGAWVQHMLRYVLGDTNWASPGVFYQALRAYGDSLRYGTANTDDYERIVEGVTGLDLEWFFDEWVYRLGYPEYHLGWQARQTGEAWSVILNLSQNNMSGAPSCFHMPVELRVRFASGDTVIRYEVASNPQRNEFPVRAQPVGVDFDPNEWILDQASVTVGIEENKAATVTRLTLLGSNPASAAVHLQVELPVSGNVRLEVADRAGRLVRTLASGKLGPGRTAVQWNRTDDRGKRLGQGVYFVRLKAGSEQRTLSLVLAPGTGSGIF
jgi:aminopeptidase N